MSERCERTSERSSERPSTLCVDSMMILPNVHYRQRAQLALTLRLFLCSRFVVITSPLLPALSCHYPLHCDFQATLCLSPADLYSEPFRLFRRYRVSL